MITRRSALAAFAVLGLLSLAPAGPAVAADPVVFAAASLQDALNDVAARYKAATGKTVTISYGASSSLARQIAEAAPVDIFFSADPDWMNELQAKGFIQTASRVSLLGNQIVLVTAKTATTPSVALAKGVDLLPLLGRDGRLAMANVESVPAGRYGKAALEWLGAWPSVSSRIVQGADVRAALAFVARGEAPLGIVYGTDANADTNVKVIGTFPSDSHPPIVYPVALIATSTDPDAKAFFDFLKSPAAIPAYTRQGFSVLTPAG